MQAAQGSGQVCPQFNAGQWGFQHPNNNATWGGATTNNFFWNQGLPQMAQSPAQQVINQPLALLTYPAQPTPTQQYHITPVLPDSVYKPEQDVFNSVPAQLTTVKTQQEEATQRISHQGPQSASRGSQPRHRPHGWLAHLVDPGGSPSPVQTLQDGTGSGNTSRTHTGARAQAAPSNSAQADQGCTTQRYGRVKNQWPTRAVTNAPASGPTAQ